MWVALCHSVVCFSGLAACSKTQLMNSILSVRKKLSVLLRLSLCFCHFLESKSRQLQPARIPRKFFLQNFVFLERERVSAIAHCRDFSKKQAWTGPGHTKWLSSAKSVICQCHHSLQHNGTFRLQRSEWCCINLIILLNENNSCPEIVHTDPIEWSEVGMFLLELFQLKYIVWIEHCGVIIGTTHFCFAWPLSQPHFPTQHHKIRTIMRCTFRFALACNIESRFLVHILWVKCLVQIWFQWSFCCVFGKGNAQNLDKKQNRTFNFSVQQVQIGGFKMFGLDIYFYFVLCLESG